VIIDPNQMRKSNPILRTVNVIFFVLFLISAALQYNDPDPYIWIPIYLYAAVLCFYAFRSRYFPKAYIAGIIVYAILAVPRFLDNDGVLSWMNEHNSENLAQSMKASKPYIENAREFFGLLILIISLLANLIYYNWVFSKNRSQSKASSA
jgi:hypothetical protein